MVDLLSAGVGAGHHAAAHAIAAQFEGQGYSARVWDVLDLMPGGFGRLIQTVYVGQLQIAPSTYRWMLRRSSSGRLDRLMHQGLRPVNRQLLQIAADRPIAMISTHPFASQALGELRARRLLDVPVVTYLTDMSVHRAWVHRSVDLHLTLHELAAGDARRAGAGQIEVVRPAVSGGTADGSSPRSREAARQALGLPRHGRLVLVTGGSEGLGDLERTANDLLPGHGVANASLLDQAGLAPWVRSSPHLGDAISTAIARSTLAHPAWSTQQAGWPSVVEAVLTSPWDRSV